MTTRERKVWGVRRLARQELELWRQVTRHVKPIRDKPAANASSDAPPPPTRSQSGWRPPSCPPMAEAVRPNAKSRELQIKTLAPLEHRLLRKLSRGHSDPAARIDLHGMRQAEAHHRLRGFLQQAQADGLSLALVVTGKGTNAREADRHEQRGVLRRMLPHWLAAPELRHIVLGFSEAARRHGGEGAFYVRLRTSGRR